MITFVSLAEARDAAERVYGGARLPSPQNGPLIRRLGLVGVVTREYLGQVLQSDICQLVAS